MLTAILLAIAAFAATNIDNLFVLLAFLAESHDKWDVVAGQYLGSLALVVLACGLASLMLGVPGDYVGLVGVMPVLIGIGKLLQWVRRANGQGTNAAGASPGQRPHRGSSIWMVATVAIANGSDNLAVYVPLFAGRPRAQVTAIAAVFVAMIGLWCAVGLWLVSHRVLGGPIRRYGHLLLPWVLILIGISVIVEHGTLRVFGL
jgi:cadmium resistance protein CadD (predicted permease)